MTVKSCPSCGVLVHTSGLKVHIGSLRCRVEVSQTEMKAQGWVVVHGKAASHLRSRGAPMVRRLVKYYPGAKGRRTSEVYAETTPAWAYCMYCLGRNIEEALVDPNEQKLALVEYLLYVDRGDHKEEVYEAVTAQLELLFRNGS